MKESTYKNQSVYRLEEYNNKDYNELTEYIKRILSGENIAQRVRIDHTRFCNLRCNYCVSGMDEYDGKTLSQQYIPMELIKRLIDPLLQLKVTTVNFYGGGEPLLHPNFDEIINLFAANNFLIQIITNGSLLNEKNQEAILKNHTNIPVLRFSIHGLSERLFKEITRTNLYKQTLKRCAEFNKKAQAQNISSTVGLFVPLINDFTEDEFDSFMQYVIENKFELLYFSGDYRNRTKMGEEQSTEPPFKSWIKEYQIKYPEIDINYIQPYETEYTQNKCYIESTNIDLAFEPDSKKLLRVRCSNFHPSGYSDLPTNNGFTVLEPEALVDNWTEHLNNIRQSKNLNCEEKHRCISFKRNFKLANMMSQISQK